MTHRYAVLTNDLQVAARTKSDERRAAVDAFLPHQVRFLHAMRALGVPVIHLQLVIAEADLRSPDMPDELRFTRGSAGVQILAEVRAPGDIVVEKPKDSGFFDTKLDEVLRSLDVDTVVICGMQAQICVQTTAADAHFRGYGVVIPSDCVVSTRAEDMELALRWLSNYCATVLTADEVVQLVRTNAAIPVSADA